MVFSLGFSPELADVFIKMHLENKKRKKKKWFNIIIFTFFILTTFSF
jgi:hypothetical protein